MDLGSGHGDVAHRIPRPAPAESTAPSLKPYSGMPVAWRRRLVLALNLITILAIGILVYRVLSPTRFFGPETVMLAGFLLATPGPCWASGMP